MPGADGERRSKLTVVLAIAAIVAAVGLLLAGLLLAPDGGDEPAGESSMAALTR